MREFTVIIERDEEGWFVGSVPELPGCHTQAKSLDKLNDRIQEAIAACLEATGKRGKRVEFIGVQRVRVSA